MLNAVEKKNKFFSVSSWRSLSPILTLRHTVQGCIDDESMAICVNLTDASFDLSLSRKKAKTSNTQSTGRVLNAVMFVILN